MQTVMPKQQAGFSYLIPLFLVAVLSIWTVRAMENIATTARRDKEAELIAIGLEYRRAILIYYENSPGTAKAYPKSLADLLLDERATKIARPLRRLYRDPMTNQADWGLIKAKDGAVMGVYSLSTGKPMKQKGFPAELSMFEGATRYQDWKFSYQP